MSLLILERFLYRPISLSLLSLLSRLLSLSPLSLSLSISIYSLFSLFLSLHLSFSMSVCLSVCLFLSISFFSISLSTHMFSFITRFKLQPNNRFRMQTLLSLADVRVRIIVPILRLLPWCTHRDSTSVVSASLNMPKSRLCVVWDCSAHRSRPADRVYRFNKRIPCKCFINAINYVIICMPWNQLRALISVIAPNNSIKHFCCRCDADLGFGKKRIARPYVYKLACRLLK